MENLVTNGPFRLTAWRPGEILVLERNPDYHNQVSGNVDRIELYLDLDVTAQIGRYDAGELDVLQNYTLNRLSISEFERVRHRHAADYFSAPRMGTIFLGFDVSRPPFDETRVRQAFAFATDRDTLVDVCLRGLDFPAHGGFLPPGIPGHSEGIGLFFNPESSRRLLAEAGYSDNRSFPAVEALVPPPLSSYSEFLRQHWLELLGIDIQWKVLDWDEFIYRALEKPPHIYINPWVGHYPDPDYFLRAGFIRKSAGWHNQTYENLVEEAWRLSNLEERIDRYREADRIFIEDAVVIPLTYMRWHQFVKPWVKRFPISEIPLWKDVIIESH
jgi:ABC-type oligopeptide transport system substrate-binding subunit